MNLSAEQKHILVHATGLSQSETPYRSHYNDRVDNPILLELVQLGLMTGPRTSSMFPEGYGNFHVTPKGLDLAYEFKQAGVT